MAVTLINVFSVPDEKEQEFLENWKETAKIFQKKRGFLETHLHRNTGAGNKTFQFINIAKWESAEAWKTIHDEYRPGEYTVEGVKGHPSIFEAIVNAKYDGDEWQEPYEWTW